MVCVPIVNIGLTISGGLPFVDASYNQYYLVDGNPFYNGITTPYFTIGTHTISVKDSIGCNRIFNFTITSGCGPCNIPHISIGADHKQTYHLPNNPAALVYCYGTQITMIASNVSGATYSWTGPNGFTASTRQMNIANATPVNSGRYRCIASLSATCKDTAYVDVFVAPKLAVTTTTPINRCENTNVVLTATSNQSPTTFVWIKNLNVVSNSFVLNSSTNGVYSVIGTNIYGCTASAATVVNILSAPIPVISGATSVCVGSTIQETATPLGGVWSSTAGRATINASGVVTGTSAGTANIRYTVVYANGCSQYANKPITVNTIPAVPSLAYAPGYSNPTTPGGFCTNRIFGVVGSPIGGTWSSTGIISISPVGVVSTGPVAGVSSFTYTYTNAAGCSSSRTIARNIILCTPRGIANNGQLTINNLQFTMYPNPTKSVVNFNVEKLVGSGQIIVTNILGKQIKTLSLSMGANTVDVSSFAKGMYLVTIVTNEGRQTEKLVVE